jgi:hypothetical protein
MATRHHWLAWLGLLAGACGAGEEPETLGQYTAEMQVAIDAMQAQLSAHHDTMHASWDADAVASREWQHRLALSEHADRLQRAHEGVTMCGQHVMRAHHHSGMGALMAQNEAVYGLVGEAFREFGRHSHAIDMAGSQALAMAEESEHARIMDELLGRFSAHCEGMLVALDEMSENASRACPAYTRVPAR